MASNVPVLTVKVPFISVAPVTVVEVAAIAYVAPVLTVKVPAAVTVPWDVLTPDWSISKL